ncbi:hypothetical protein PMAYCL1PPCAC_21341, partial [Pristionchus mayeri]
LMLMLCFSFTNAFDRERWLIEDTLKDHLEKMSKYGTYKTVDSRIRNFHVTSVDTRSGIVNASVSLSYASLLLHMLYISNIKFIPEFAEFH